MFHVERLLMIFRSQNSETRMSPTMLSFDATLRNLLIF